MRRIRFQKHVYQDCETCNGEGFIVTGCKAGFDVKNMEVTIKDDGYFCPECLQRSMDEYDMVCDQEYERHRDGENY